MKVSTTQPFQIIYSLFKHQYLGYLFESFVVQVNSLGKLTLLHQNISHKNAFEFSKNLDETDFKLIELMDQIQQDSILNKFIHSRVNPENFFLKVYDETNGDKAVQEAIYRYIESRMALILEMLVGKRTFIMGKNGEPTWKEVEVCKEKATVLFHFRKNEENTHYFPTIKLNDEKINFQYNDSKILCEHPAWMMVENQKIITFEKNVDGKKLRPFLSKKFIEVPKKIEKTYYKNFITQLVESYDVYAKGFDIITDHFKTIPLLYLTETGNGSTLNLFGESNDNNIDSNIVFELLFEYGDFKLPYSSSKKSVSVRLEENEGKYTFHRISRLKQEEEEYIRMLNEKLLDISKGRKILNKTHAYSWINSNYDFLVENGFKIEQKNFENKSYYIGKSSIDIQIKENDSNDWFDVYGVAKFGEYEIPFIELRDIILKGKKEFVLPNGQIAIIPEEWLVTFFELFSFSEGKQVLKLKKHFLSYVNELESSNMAKVSMNRKLQRITEIDSIEEYDLPTSFQGTLRSYQKAGYNWLNFLDEFSFGGCLADDMGLGKTVQALALLSMQKEKGAQSPSLLVLPTSLVYNWQKEAVKFTPSLRVFVYTGTYRDKNTDTFNNYDLIITTYGILRLDVNLLENYYFNYIILDESQTIKNPNSNIFNAVKTLKSRRKLILTGTPIENTTIDLWSQMSFVNPGLLGSLNFFKKEFSTPIEKNADLEKTKKLNKLIQPFLLRRDKKQVASDLPEKNENIHYCEMSEEQEKIYEETKSYYRNSILKLIDENGINKSKFIILQGLTKLRQIANHPLLIDETYAFDSGKFEEVSRMIINAIKGNHKVLIFSQFVNHLAIFKSYLLKENIQFSYLDGSTKDRKLEVENFQSNEEIKVFLISLKAGGVGLNLTAADYVFMLDPWWNPAAESQAIDRAHRIGQQKTVFTYKFITKNTVEEKILNLQNKKLELAKDLISIDENIIKTLNKDDIESILS